MQRGYKLINYIKINFKQIMKTVYTVIGLFLCLNFTYGQQKFLTKEGDVSFFSTTPMEDIKADNNQVLSIVDTENGNVAITILIKSFMFEKSLMQEHFNENYMESGTYPKAKFKGSIDNFSALKAGSNEVVVKGDMTIHGVTKSVETKASLFKSEDSIVLRGAFDIEIADYNIEIPSVVAANIAKKVAVKFDLDHKPYTK